MCSPVWRPLYPCRYPVAGQTGAEIAGFHRSNRAQSEPAGPARRFRYAVPISLSSARSEFGSGLFVARRPPAKPLSEPLSNLSCWLSAGSGSSCYSFCIARVSTRIIGRRRRRPVQFRGEPHRRSGTGPCWCRSAGQAGCLADEKNSVSASAIASGWVSGPACPAPGISCIRALGTRSVTARALAAKSRLVSDP